MKLVNLVFWILTFLIVSLLYFYKLDSIPRGFYIDEAMPGYNAYSILKTGKDEYGKSFPLGFRFYGSYNPPIPVYLMVIPEFFLGMNVFAVRLVPALMGVLSALVLMIFLKESKIIKNINVIFVCGLFALISPWIFFHSRVGYEIVPAFLFFEIGALFLWRSLSNFKYSILAIIFLNLLTYTAYSGRYLTPILIIGFLFIFRKEVFKLTHTRILVTNLIITIFLQIPNIYLLFTPSFFPKGQLLPLSIIFSQSDKIFLLPKAFSVVLAFVREFLSQYVAYFSPKSLFFLPDPDLQRSIPGLSVFYSWMIIPFIVGVYYLFNNYKTKFTKFILLLLLVSPIPASLTKDPFATHRSIALFLPLFTIICIGLNHIVDRLRFKVSIPVLILVFTFSLLLLWRSYFIIMPLEREKDWGYGYKAMAEVIQSSPDKEFIIDQTRSKPHYIELAFFMNIDPNALQNSVDPNIAKNYYQNIIFDSNYKFANIQTRGIDWKLDIYENRVLVGDSLAISENQAKEHFLSKYFQIDNYFGDTIFIGYETDPFKKCQSVKFEGDNCIKWKP